jgi:hypothetical protein
MRTTLSTLTLAAAAVLSTNAYAGDKEVLDLLVKKGVITAEERAKAIQESKAKDISTNLDEVFAKEEAVKRLTISGRVQVQYEGMSYSDSGTRTRTVTTNTSTNGGAPVVTTTGTGVTNYDQEADSTNDFILRRMYLGAKADIGEGFSGELVWNFADGSNGGEFDKAVFTSESAYGKFDIGYQKVMWGQEENTSSGAMAVVERSLVTRYWAEGNNGRRLGFGARHTGIHYSDRALFGGHGEADVRYGFSVVRADQNANFSSNVNGANDLGLYGFASVAIKPINLTVGVNVAENKHAGATTDATTIDDDSIKGFNPYLRWESGDLSLIAEYIDTDVTKSGVTRNPTGYNITGLLKASEKLEFVARYAALDTDGRGVSAGDGLRNIGTTGTHNLNYNEADSIYLGVNYYFNKNNAKIQVGYEIASLTDALSTSTNTTSTSIPSGTVDQQVIRVQDARSYSNSSADANVFRVQVQILF